MASNFQTRITKVLQDGQKIAEDLEKSSEALIKEARSQVVRANTLCVGETTQPANRQGFPAEQTNLERSIDEIEKYLDGNNQWMENIQKEVKDLLEEFGRLESENNNLRKSPKRPFWHRIPIINRFQTKKPRVTCQVYCAHDVENTTIKYGLTELEKILSTPGELELDIKICQSASAIKTALPIVVICFDYARIGTAVNSALRGIEPGPNVALLILHHKDIHALPTQKTELTAPDYQRLGAIIDMAFLSDRGIYECEMNKKAVAELISFINNR